MKFHSDDPRWTAYVLGELDETETAAIDAELADNPEARAYVDSLRDTTDLLSQELGEAPTPALSDLQRKAIQKAAVDAPRPRRWPAAVVAGTALAAAAGLVVVLSPKSESVRYGSAPRAKAAVATASGSEYHGKDRVLGNQGQSTEELPRGEEREKGRYWDGEPGTDQPAYQMTPRPSNEKRPPVYTLQPTGGDGDGRHREPSDPNAVEITTAPSSGRVVIDGQPGHSSADGWQYRGGSIQLQKKGFVAANKNIDLPESPDEASAMAFRLGKENNVDEDRAANTEAYDRIVDNPFVAVSDDPRSTFSIDVDTASYSNIRRYLRQNHSLPPKDAVRIEEMVNYFAYDYAPPTDGKPFAVHVDTSVAPWNRDHRLLRIGLKGKVPAHRPRANLVFLIDVSGSMSSAEKLPLLKRAMKLLIDRLDVEDRVAMVVYAGNSGLVLPSTPAAKKREIRRALERLEAGGSTNGGAGIELAYKIAKKHFVKGGVNRVILATDGDFNVGTTSRGDLSRLIENKAKSGVFLTVLGFGMGNYKDANLEKLADRGNGNYAYIDTANEARKVLADEAGSTLLTIAKDVKIQIEFNPTQVSSYRLIGYENRVLAHRDFNDDKKDAGDIGAGHTVTALYELVPARQKSSRPAVDPLKYQASTRPTEAAYSDELMTLKLRYKAPDGQRSRLLEYPVSDWGTSLEAASADFKFAAAVASFGMILRDSEHRGDSTLSGVLDLAAAGAERDPHGYRREFIDLVRLASRLGAR